MTTVTGFHHLALTVSDADASFEFYRQLLGLEEAFQIDDETVRVRVFAGDGFLFGVRHYKSHDKDRFSEFRTGMDHSPSPSPTARHSQDSSAGSPRLGAVYTPPGETPLGPVVVFRDPDGIQGEFFLPAG